MSKTPRTDDFRRLKRTYAETLSFEKQLEAELNEARLELSEIGGELSDTKNYLFEQRKLLEQALEALLWNCESCKYADFEGKPNCECQCAPCIVAIQAIQNELGERTGE
jgi:hypothetical protein